MMLAAVFDVGGMSAFPTEKDHGVGRLLASGYCKHAVFEFAMKVATNPTLNFQIGDLVNIPFIKAVGEDPTALR